MATGRLVAVAPVVDVHVTTHGGVTDGGVTDGGGTEGTIVFGGVLPGGSAGGVVDCDVAATAGTTAGVGMPAPAGVVVGAALALGSGAPLENGAAVGAVPLDVGVADRTVEDGVRFIVVAVDPRGMRAIGMPRLPGSAVVTVSGDKPLVSSCTDSPDISE